MEIRPRGWGVPLPLRGSCSGSASLRCWHCGAGGATVDRLGDLAVPLGAPAVAPQMLAVYGNAFRVALAGTGLLQEHHDLVPGEFLL
jgi:hypothetical protein